MDGFVAIGGCDKDMPGAMICIARMNRPAELNSLSASNGERVRGEVSKSFTGTIFPDCLTLNSSVAMN